MARFYRDVFLVIFFKLYYLDIWCCSNATKGNKGYAIMESPNQVTYSVMHFAVLNVCFLCYNII